MHSIPEVNFEEVIGREGNLGLITLNRPKVLNALNHEMFIAMAQQLKEWEAANHIKAVIIRAAEGRAFCAGGDIRSAYDRKKANDATLINFFRDEYQLNRSIHHFSKPYIALLDGITMGGGVGVSIHGSHRIATQRLIFAMPETGIGFYPDVGTTYVLSRLPGKMGVYLGLTGARISYTDCHAIGLVDDIMSAINFPDFIYTLADTSLKEDAHATVSRIIQKYAIPAGESNLKEHSEEIAACFAKESVEEIIAALEAYPTEWCHEQAAILKTKSPISLKVTLHAYMEAVKLDFDACMLMEYRLTSHFVRGDEFFEGIRAAVIDKDQKPQWKPAKLEEINLKDVKEYFAPVETELV